MVIYTCKAIISEENKKIKCTVNIATNQIQLIGKFANHAKGRVIKFDDFRLLSTNIGKEKLGLFKKDYIEILYNGKSLRKLYFKNFDTAHCFENAIKDRQETIRKEDEEKIRLEEKTYLDAMKFASGKTVKDQEKAIKLFTEVIDWKDSKDQIESCKQVKKKYEEAEFYNKIDEIISQSKQVGDNPQKHSDNIKIAPKTAVDLFIKNPYFVLGISCTSEQSKMLDVRDKIEKFARLKLAGGYKSAFDLKNIEKPSRDISSIQAAIVAAKDIAAKWLWFETDKYCSWWDKDEIFSLYEKEQNCSEYDLILACFINAMICSPSFADSKKWNVVFTSIDKLLAKPKNELLKVLKKHIGSSSLNDEEIIVSFKESILNPIKLLFENASKEQISNFSKINIPKIMSEAISSAISIAL